MRLKDRRRRATVAVMSAVRQEVEDKVPGVEVELAELMEDLIGDLTAVPQPIEIKLFAIDPSVLGAQAQKVAAAISKIDGVVEVKSGLQLAGDALNVRIDPIRAGVEGATPDDVAQAVDQAVNGAVATFLPQPAKAVGVRVRLPDALTLHEEDPGRPAHPRQRRSSVFAEPGRGDHGRRRSAADQPGEPAAHGGGDRPYRRARGWRGGE